MNFKQLDYCILYVLYLDEENYYLSVDLNVFKNLNRNDGYEKNDIILFEEKKYKINNIEITKISDNIKEFIEFGRKIHGLPDNIYKFNYAFDILFIAERLP